MHSLVPLVVSLFAPQAQGAVGIRPAGGVSGGCVHPTIAAALAAAVDGDTLLIAPGTYAENLGTIHKSVTFQGSNLGCTLDGGGVTIDANGGQVAFVTPAFGAPPNTVAFRGVTLTDGFANVGGLLFVSGAHLDLDDAVLNHSTSNGGGCVAVTGGTLDLSGSTDLDDCFATGNGGAVLAVLSDVTMTDTALISHSETLLDGGGIFLDNGTLSIDGETDLFHNTADGAGGAIYAVNASVTIGGDAVVGPANTADDGGGIAVRSVTGVGVGASLLLTGNARVTENAASSLLTAHGGGIHAIGDLDDPVAVELAGSSRVDLNTSTSFGGGIAIESARLGMTADTVVSENSATSDGGGIWAVGSQEGGFALDAIGGRIEWNVSGGDGGGAFLGEESHSSVQNVTFADNSAPEGDGGGLAVVGQDADVEVISNPATCDPALLPANTWCSQFRDNDAVRGGAAYAGDGALLDVDRALMKSNTASDQGSAVFGDVSSGVRLANALVARNAAFGANTAAVHGHNALFLDHLTVVGNTGSAGIRYAAGSGGNLNRTISWGNTGAGLVRSGAPVGGCNDFSSVVGGGIGLGFMVGVNPMFVNSAGNDFHLQAGSPLLEVCALASALDLDHVTRVGNVDLGAFEAP